MIKVIITTAIIYPDHHRYGNADLIKLRHNQYCDFFKYMKKINLPQYCCECINNGPNSFLNDLIDNVFYSCTHNPAIRNQGVDEIAALRAFINHYNFDDNDMIIKLTGRYTPNSNLFFDYISLKEDKYDGFFHAFPVSHSGYGQIFTGAFAIRLRLLKKYLDSVNLNLLERNMINIEYDIYQFIKNIKSIKYLNKLDITVFPGGGEDLWQI